MKNLIHFARIGLMAALFSITFNLVAAEETSAFTGIAHPLTSYKIRANIAGQTNGSVADILLIQTSNPWNSVADPTVLNKLGRTYQIVDWSQISGGSVDIFSYQVVLIVNDQVQAFYDQLANETSQFEQYVQNGGTLVIFAAANGWANGSITAPLPGGLVRVWSGQSDYYHYGKVVDPTHPIVSDVLSEGIPLLDADLYGNYCTHGYFSTLPPNTRVVLADTDNHPTLVEYRLGKGTVVASTHTWEFHYDRPNSYGAFGIKALDDVFLYAFSIAGGHADGLKVAVYPEDNWLAKRPALYKCPGDVIDITADVQNNGETNIPNVTVSMQIDDSLVDPGYIKVFKRKSADHIAIENYDDEVYTTFTDTTTSGKRVITLQNLSIDPQKSLPKNIWNDFVFQFRLRTGLQGFTAVNATATVQADGFKDGTQDLNSGGQVVVKSWESYPNIILVNRKGVYQQYATINGQIDFSDGGKRDQLHLLWESLYRIAANRNAAIEFVDKIEFASDTDHTAANEVIREWPTDRLHLGNGDAQGHYHYDNNPASNNEENTINKVAIKVDNYLKQVIQRSGGLSADGRDVLIFGGDNLIPHYRAFSPGNQVYNFRNDGYNATGVTQTDANNNYFFTDIYYRDFDGTGWQSGNVEDIYVGRIAGPDVNAMKSLFEATDKSASVATQVVKMENKMRDGSLDAYQADAPNDGYTILASANGQTLDKPRADAGDDPARWNDFLNLFTTQQFDLFRCIAHGNVDGIYSSENYYSTYMNGGNMYGARNSLSTAFSAFLPMFVFDNCLVGLVDGANNSQFFNAFSRLPIRGFFGSSCITYSTYCSDHNSLLTQQLFDGEEFGSSVNYANRNYTIGLLEGWGIGGAGDIKKNTKMQMNLFGDPWAKLTPPNQRANNARVQAKSMIGNGVVQMNVVKPNIAGVGNLITKTVVIDSSSYSLTNSGGFDFLSITGFRQLQNDGQPVLPYAEYVINVPDDITNADVSVIFSNTISLGAKNIPVYASPIPFPGAPGDYAGGIYRNCATNLGIFPPAPRFEQWFIKANGGNYVKVLVMPAQYDTGSRQLSLSQTPVITVSYSSDSNGKLRKVKWCGDVLSPNTNLVVGMEVENLSPTNEVFFANVIIKDQTGAIVSSTTNNSNMASGDVMTIDVQSIAPSTPGQYTVDAVLSQQTGGKNLGVRRHIIQVSQGLLLNLNVPPTMQPGQPNSLSVQFQSYLASSANALVDIYISKLGGGQVAKLPQFSGTVLSMGTTNLETFWIPSTNLDNGTYFASATVTVNSLVVGPIVEYFQLGTSVFEDVSQYTTNTFASWTVDRVSGALVCSLTIGNNTGSPKTLKDKFYFALPSTANVRLANPTGTLDDGTPYLDITASVQAALPGVGNGDLNLDPGEQVTISGIKIYSRDRSMPAGFIFAMWADPPALNVAGSSGGMQLVRSRNGSTMLSWPMAQTGYVMQESDSLSSTNWKTIQSSPVIRGSNNTLPVPIATSGSKFYRMKKQ